MSEHRARIDWRRDTPDFRYETYSRSHTWRFEGGVEVPASSAPEYVGDPSRVDPESALVAALSSCHMLTFLSVAARRRLTVNAYRDEAVGFMEKNADGKIAVTRVVLRPAVEFEGPAPSEADLEKLHHLAHEHCFIANSVKTEVTVEPQG
jgi:organic hydroperoxide reductase OsmC/OhrA